MGRFVSCRLLATLLTASAVFFLLHAGPSFAELVVTRQTTPRADGSQIEWQLTRPSPAWRGPLIVISQGSSCEAVTRSQGVAAISQAFASDFAILLVEKRGVSWDLDERDDYGEPVCSPEYEREVSVPQRVEDYALVLADMQRSAWWNGQLILLGGSEGGLAMAMLSQKVEPAAAILLSSIGDQTFQEMVLDVIPGEGKAEAKIAFDEARRDPSATKQFASVSYAYWAKSLDLNPVSYMTSLKTQYLIVQGSRNDDPTSAHARAAFDALAPTLGCNLTYWEIAGLDHQFIDPRGTRQLDKVSRQLHSWASTILREPTGVLECH